MYQVFQSSFFPFWLFKVLNHFFRVAG